jgi:hypothetical protein
MPGDAPVPVPPLVQVVPEDTHSSGAYVEALSAPPRQHSWPDAQVSAPPSAPYEQYKAPGVDGWRVGVAQSATGVPQFPPELLLPELLDPPEPLVPPELLALPELLAPPELLPMPPSLPVAPFLPPLLQAPSCTTSTTPHHP